MTSPGAAVAPPGPFPAPPTGRGPFRRTAYALGVTAFAAGVPTPLYAIYEAEFGFNAAALAAIFAAYTVGVLATTFLVAPLSDTIGRRPVLFVGMALTAAGAAVFLVANGAGVLALARIVSGLAVGATTSTATAAMAGLEPNRDPHHVARVSVAANFGGVATGILLAGVLVTYAPAPTRLVFVVVILAAAVGALAIAATPETVPPPTQRRPLRIQRLRVPASDRLPFWVAAGSLAACYAVYGFFASLAPTFLRVDLAVGNRALAAALVAVLFGSAALVQPALGQVRDRRALLIGLPLMTVGAAGVLGAILLTSLPLLAVGALALGVGVGFAYMGAVTLVDRTAPAGASGEILAAFFVVGYVALAVPTIGIGVAADAVGLGTAALVFGGAVGLFVLGLAFVTRRTPTPPGGEGRPRDPV
jgi:MFS family permease